MKNENTNGICKEIIDWLNEYASHSIDSQSMDKNGYISPNIILDFGEKGFFGLLTSKKHGGKELKFDDFLQIIKAISEIDLSLAVFIAGHNIICFHLEKVLPTSSSNLLKTYSTGRKFIGMAITEEDVGSNFRGISTNAILLDNGDWVISGKKKWAGLAAWAHEICVLAKDENNNYMVFLMPLNTPGVKLLSKSDGMGLKAFPRNTILFNKVRLKNECILNKAPFKNGISLINSIFKLSRITIGAMSLGVMNASYHIMSNYARHRFISTGIMIDNDNIQILLLEQVIKIKALEMILKYSQYLFNNKNKDEEFEMELAKVIKNIGAQTAWNSADKLMQFLGGRGYEENNLAPKILRDCRAMRIFEGTTEVLRLSLGASIFLGKDKYIEKLESYFGKNDESKVLIEKINAIEATFGEDFEEVSSKFISMGEIAEIVIASLILKREGLRNREQILNLAIQWYEKEITIVSMRIDRKLNFNVINRKEVLSEFEKQHQFMNSIQNRIPIEYSCNEYLQENPEEQASTQNTPNIYSEESTVLVHELFSIKAREMPLQTAISCDSTLITYQELDNITNLLAQHLLSNNDLQSNKQSQEKIVAIVTERSDKTIISMLSILKMGFAFCIIDPSYPQKRIKYILQNLNPCLVIYDNKKLRYHDSTTNTFYLPTLNKLSKLKQVCLPERVSSNSLAYVVYTSGTTGEPKGVMLENEGLAKITKDLIIIYKLDNNSRVFQFVAPTFDVFISDVFMTLCSGATLFVKKGPCLLGNNLTDYLEDKSITHVQLPASVLGSLPQKSLPALSYIGVGGEVCSKEAFKFWRRNRTLFNLYGPSEATITSLAYKGSKKYPLPLGFALGGKICLVLNAHLKPVVKGETGELYIGGYGLARGYLHLPKMTEEKFVTLDGERYYKTGDLVKVISDKGHLSYTYIGRKDNQLKLNGVRIEPEEIEATLLKIPSISVAVVTHCFDENSNKYLSAYIGLKASVCEKSIIERCKRSLSQSLPKYCMPNIFIILKPAEFPLTKNGKIDRKNLSSRLIHKLELNHDALPFEESSPTQSLVFDLIKQTLNVQHITINDDFFELGGDSIKAAEFLIKINKQASINLPLNYLFKNSKIGTLVDCIVNLDKPAEH